MSMVMVYKEIKEKLVWHVFFFKVHLLAHQRRDDVGVGVERLCSRWGSLLVPSGVRSGGTATGDPASGEDTKPVRIISVLIDYIDIMYLLEKLFNALYVF